MCQTSHHFTPAHLKLLQAAKVRVHRDVGEVHRVGYHEGGQLLLQNCSGKCEVTVDREDKRLQGGVTSCV